MLLYVKKMAILVSEGKTDFVYEIFLEVPNNYLEIINCDNPLNIIPKLFKMYIPGHLQTMVVLSHSRGVYKTCRQKQTK